MEAWEEIEAASVQLPGAPEPKATPTEEAREEGGEDPWAQTAARPVLGVRSSQ